jgi:hypothetical protein
VDHRATLAARRSSGGAGRGDAGAMTWVKGDIRISQLCWCELNRRRGLTPGPAPTASGQMLLMHGIGHDKPAAGLAHGGVGTQFELDYLDAYW